MNKPSPTPAAERWLDPALLLRAAEDSCEPRTVLFEAIAEVADHSDKPDKAAKSYEPDTSDNPAKADCWSNRLYASLIDLEAHEAANPGSGPRIDEAIRMLARLAADISAGNFSISYVADMLRLLDYETKIRQAEETGALRGRNEAIRQQLDRNFGGDGLPALNTNSIGESKRRAPSIFDLAAQA